MLLSRLPLGCAAMRNLFFRRGFPRCLSPQLAQARFSGSDGLFPTRPFRCFAPDGRFNFRETPALTSRAARF